MNFIKNFYKNHKKILISFIIFTVVATCGISFYLSKSKAVYGPCDSSLSMSDDKLSLNSDSLSDDISLNGGESNEKNGKDIKGASESGDVTCYISGEVSTPGVIKLKNGSRLSDAVSSLGGLTEKADKNRVNLALKLQDEVHYIIPSVNDIETANPDVQNSSDPTNTSGSGNSSSGGSENSSKSDSLVNINEADESKLVSLPGIGKSTAQKIISYREKNGKFSTPEDLKNVSGIGEKKFEAVSDFITVK